MGLRGSARWWGAAVLALALVGCSTGDATPVPAPSGDAGQAPLAVDITGFPATVPAPGSGERFMISVAIQNVGPDPYEWPDPCPVVRWDWSESATSFGNGYLQLDCTSGELLDAEACESFDLPVKSADEAGGLRFMVDLVDPRGEQGGGLLVSSEDRSVTDWDSLPCDGSASS